MLAVNVNVHLNMVVGDALKHWKHAFINIICVLQNLHIVINSGVNIKNQVLSIILIHYLEMRFYDNSVFAIYCLPVVF